MVERGPSWLAGYRERPTCEVKMSEVQEEDVTSIENCMLTSCDRKENFIDVKRFGSYIKALRTAAWVLRYAKKLQKEKISGPITPEEFEKVELLLIKQEQRDLMRHPTSGTTERNTASQLHGVGVLTDTEGIIRVKGWLERSDMTYDERHPIMLRKDSKLAELLV